jgi:calcineurin-like phosphoesterase family protein
MKHFTSDHHFGHTNIIRLAKRPFDDIEEMHATMIRNWKNQVAPGDEVYCLGDFSFWKKPERIIALLHELPGQKFLIKGNHDRKVDKWSEPFVWVKDYHELTIVEPDKVKRKIVLCHYPFLTWNKGHRGSWNLHGHCHSKIPLDPKVRRLDVGVDGHDFRPWTYDEVKKAMEGQEDIGHH